jgi:hypothetical protein
MFGDYYNESVRKLVVAFGNLFNEIYIRKIKEEGGYTRIRVPLTYTPKEKFYRRIREPGTITDNTRIQIDLPRMCFSLKNLSYDTARKLNKLNARTVKDPVTNQQYSVNKVVPYNFTFEMTSFTRSIDENLQIAEQILPYFAPEYVLKLNFNEVYEGIDVPFILDSVSLYEDSEGSFEERRILMNTFNFTVKSHIFGPVTSPTTIETTTFNYDNIDFLQ